MLSFIYPKKLRKSFFIVRKFKLTFQKILCPIVMYCKLGEIEVCHTLLQNSFVNIFSFEKTYLTVATVWCKINFSLWQLNWSNSLSLEGDTFYSQVILHLVLLTFFFSCKSQKVTSCKLTERKAWPKLSNKFLYKTR